MADYDREVRTTEELMLLILKELRTMALDLSKLAAAITQVATDVTSLINADTSAAQAAAAQLALDQAAVDAIVPSLTAIDTVAQAALAPAPVAAPAPPAGQ